MASLLRLRRRKTLHTIYWHAGNRGIAMKSWLRAQRNIDISRLVFAAFDSGDLSPWPESCLICRLRDAADRTLTVRWLAAFRGNRGEALGVACCPLHAWRLYELLTIGDGERYPSAAASGGTQKNKSSRHMTVSRIFALAHEALAADLAEVREQHERSGWRRGVARLRGIYRQVCCGSAQPVRSACVPLRGRKATPPSWRYSGTCVSRRIRVSGKPSPVGSVPVTGDSAIPRCGNTKSFRCQSGPGLQAWRRHGGPRPLPAW